MTNPYSGIFSEIDIAEVCHEANRVIQRLVDDPVVSPVWEEAPEWQILANIEGVRGALRGNTPEASHESWLEHRLADGWVYGPEKDEAAKTHPCLIPYDELPPQQRIKDVLFVGIVRALSGA